MDLQKTHKSILLWEMFLCTFGGGGCTRTFLKFWLSSREITGKTLSVRKNIIGNINLGQFRPNVDKFGISNEIPDCRSAPRGGGVLRFGVIRGRADFQGRLFDPKIF